jgi:hypothetical protein
LNSAAEIVEAAEAVGAPGWQSPARIALIAPPAPMNPTGDRN